MRIRDIIVENFDKYIDEVLEDEADGRGDANLLTTLEFLRNRAHDTHIQPRIRVDSLINLVQGTGEQQFNLENLLAAYKNNPDVKNLIKEIKDDASGVKYAYLEPFADDVEFAQDSEGPEGFKTEPERTVDSMAKSALAKRS
jgi:hypothetical protein